MCLRALAAPLGRISLRSSLPRSRGPRLKAAGGYILPSDLPDAAAAVRVILIFVTHNALIYSNITRTAPWISRGRFYISI